jgi:CubicO group peptidase (beta-lactamase class C family)
MYISLAAIAEKITGRTWETQVKEDLFTPLRMASSTVFLQDYKNGSDRSLGYRTNASGASSAINYYYNTQLAAPAAGVISNAKDMAHWLMVWLNGGKYEGAQVLPASFVKEAFTSQIQVLPSLPAADKPDIHFSGYGFAWVVNSYRGHYRAEHGGRVEGFAAQALLYPTDSIGIIVLSNQTSSFLPQAVGNFIADKLFNLAPYDWVSDMKKATVDFYARRNPKKVEQPDIPASLPVNQYTGDYFHGAFGKIHVSSSNDSLFASMGDFRFWVKHLSADAFEFFLVEPGKVRIDTSANRPGRQLVKFHVSSTGESESMDINLDPETKPILFTRRRPQTSR